MAAFHQRVKTLFLQPDSSFRMCELKPRRRRSISRRHLMDGFICRKRRVQIRFFPPVEIPVIIIRRKTKTRGDNRVNDPQQQGVLHRYREIRHNQSSRKCVPPRTAWRAISVTRCDAFHRVDTHGRGRRPLMDDGLQNPPL
jgi:hypothetical protein